nr:glycosyltransferase family 4 protein [Siccirubricoccus soli]
MLIANNFPPIRGGSASVYAALARHAGGRIGVLASRLNYVDGLPIIGWREHDRLAPYPVQRLALLRTTLAEQPPRGLRRLGFLARDAMLRLRVATAILGHVARGSRTLCIGELLASSWVVALFRWLPGLRLVAYVHGEEITTSPEADAVQRTGRRTLARCDAIVVVSRFTLAAVEQLLGSAARSRLCLIENGVDTGRFTPGPRQPALMGFYGLEGCFVFVSVCRLVEKKGIDHSIRAFAEVVRTRPDCRYLVVGTGAQAEELRALAAEMGVADKVVFAGEVSEEELVAHYRLGDVFVMPNRRLANGDTEGFGLVFLEANGCGLPVVAGRDGGSTDAVKDEVNGLVVNGHAVADIAGAMARLHDDRALYERIRLQALEVAQRAGWEGKARAFLALCGVEEEPGAVKAAPGSGALPAGNAATPHRGPDRSPV